MPRPPNLRFSPNCSFFQQPTMSSPPPYPVLSVLSTDSYLVLTAGPHLHLHSLPALEPAASTSTLPEADQHKWLVRTTAVSKDGKWIATGCDGKELRVWEVEEGGKSIKLNSVRYVSSQSRFLR